MKHVHVRIMSLLLTLVMLLGTVPFAGAVCAEGCIDNDGNALCDTCGEAIPAQEPDAPEEPTDPEEPSGCQHTSTTTHYDPANDGMHTVTVLCECGEVVGEDLKLCVDVDHDNECDLCGAEIPDDAKLCTHPETTQQIVPAEEGKHVVLTVCTNSDCGAVTDEVSADCADEDGDDKCDLCGAAMPVVSSFSIVCPQDGSESFSSSITLNFSLAGGEAEAVQWHFSASGSCDPVLSSSSGSGMEASVSVSPNNGRGVAKVTATAAWDGGELSRTVYVSFYKRTNVTVYVKEGLKSFYFTQTKVFTKATGVSSERINNYSMHSFMTDGCASRVVLHENTKTNEDVGYVTCKTSGQFYQYDPDDYNDYSIIDLKNIYFNILEEGSFKLNFDLYEPAGGKGLTTTSGTVTIVVGDPGTEDADILYRTDGEAVTFHADDFNQYWNEYAAKNEKLDYVKFSVDNRNYGALYLDDSLRGMVSSSYKFVPFYSKNSPTTYDLDEVTYVPDPKKDTYTEEIDFIAYGKNGSVLRGAVTIIVGSLMDFTDVSTSDWFYENVRYVVDEGIMNGTSDTKFSPNSTLTRGMVVTMLYRVEGEPYTGSKNTFSDVASGMWYADAVLWAASNGIVEGMGNGKFAPDSPITREQLATILYRYAKNEKGGASYGSTDLSDFADENKISSYAVDAMKWAVHQGIMQGSGSRLNPKNTATRAEAAAMFQRFLEN